MDRALTRSDYHEISLVLIGEKNELVEKMAKNEYWDDAFTLETVAKIRKLHKLTDKTIEAERVLKKQAEES